MSPIQFNRLTPFFLTLYAITGLVIIKLFYLQVIAHGYYQDLAEREQYGYSTLPARRGEIFVEDYHSKESYTLATNITLSMIYADPSWISDPQLVGSTLAPLLFDLEQAKELDEIRYEDELETANAIENEELRNTALSKVALKSDEELASDYEKELIDILSQKTRPTILYAEDLTEEMQKKVLEAKIQGTEIGKNGNFYIYPAKLGDKNKTAETIADLFGTPIKDVKATLEGTNRYVELKHKLDTEITTQIEALLKKDRQDTAAKEKETGKTLDAPFFGIRLKNEYFRYYPEQEMASQILGFVDGAGNGEYGVEGTFNDILKGNDGIFTSQLDANGNQITVGETVIEAAQDGADITLTIDRAIQSEVEALLYGDGIEYGYAYSEPNSAQAIVIDVKTGAILAFAQYPTFNPNTAGDVFEKIDYEIPEDRKDKIITKGTLENPIYWYYVQENPDVRIEVFPNPDEEGKWLAYKNTYGPDVYKNKFLQETYEPGSVFKPLVMGAAINAGEVTPNTQFNDSGPISMDYNVITHEYDSIIHTFNNAYHGIESMTQVLEHSCNTGMTYVARKLGSSLFYSYLKAYGFLERTNVGLNDEALGQVEYYKTWTESELATKAFGQGISLTPLQLAQAYTAILNDGTMMQPYLIQRIDYPDGSVKEFEPTPVRQVLTQDTADKVVAMMTAVVESYSSIALPDHYFAGKSGTAQTYKNGFALSGKGTTEATFIGAGPVEDPQFLVIVKMDRPRSSEWAEATSGRVLKRIVSFLYDYYSIPPDKTQ